MGPCNTAAPELTRQDPLLLDSRLSLNSRFNHGWLISRRFPKPREIRNCGHNPHLCRRRRLFRALRGQHQSLDHGSTSKPAPTSTRGEAISAELSCSAAPVVQQRYYQQPQTGYYSNPYQTRYSANPNYYRGYYNNWGSSSGQACPPGRA